MTFSKLDFCPHDYHVVVIKLGKALSVGPAIYGYLVTACISGPFTSLLNE